MHILLHLQALAENCPRLTQLDLSYCTCFSEAGLTAALSVMLLRRAADGAQPLRRLNLSCIQVGEACGQPQAGQSAA